MDALSANETPNSLPTHRVLPSAKPYVSLSAQRSRAAHRRLAGHFVLAVAAGHDGNFSPLLAANHNRVVSDCSGLFGTDLVPERPRSVYPRYSMRLSFAVGVFLGGRVSGWSFYSILAVDSLCRNASKS